MIVSFLTFFFMFLPAVSTASDSNVPYYTDDDLIKYSDSYTASESSFKDGKVNNFHINTVFEHPKVYRVKYTPFEGITKRIIVAATFNDSYKTLVAIDTGADNVIISRALAEKMGLLDNSEGKLLWQASGIGGSTTAIITVLDSVEIGGARVEFVPVLITGSLSQQFDALVGMDFLSNFSVIIDSQNRQLVLEEKPEKKRLPAGRDKYWWKSNFKRFNSYRKYWLRVLRSFSKGKNEGDVETIELIKKQYQEAERLFYKLNNYAIEHNVPLSWREY